MPLEVACELSKPSVIPMSLFLTFLLMIRNVTSQLFLLSYHPADILPDGMITDSYSSGAVRPNKLFLL